MSMQEAQLTSLRSRCLRASLRGHTIARAGHYAKALGGSSGDDTSAADLLALCDAALAGKPAPAPAPKKATPPPASAPADDDGEVPPYDEWTEKELYAEAKGRDIDGRSKMGKGELVAALLADDESSED